MSRFSNDIFNLVESNAFARDSQVLDFIAPNHKCIFLFYTTVVGDGSGLNQIVFTFWLILIHELACYICKIEFVLLKWLNYFAFQVNCNGELSMALLSQEEKKQNFHFSFGNRKEHCFLPFSRLQRPHSSLHLTHLFPFDIRLVSLFDSVENVRF